MSGSLQLQLAPEAADRSGLQAVAHLTANGAQRAEVVSGTPVTFTVEAELPPGAGTIRAVQWNADRGPAWSEPQPVEPGSRLSWTIEHAYDAAGTYFPAARVLSASDDQIGANGYEVQSLARARVIVT